MGEEIVAEEVVVTVPGTVKVYENFEGEAGPRPKYGSTPLHFFYVGLHDLLGPRVLHFRFSMLSFLLIWHSSCYTLASTGFLSGNCLMLSFPFVWYPS